MNYNWHKHIQALSYILGRLVFSDSEGKIIATDEGFDALRKMTFMVRESGKTVYAIGNGASASMASHFSADLAKNARLHTQVFSDLSLITAISNDLSYEEVFAEPLRRRGKPGDILIAISSSGNSPNIIRAIKVAKEMALDVVTITAMSSDNTARKLGTVNIHVPADTFGKAETTHAAILHYWIDLCVEDKNND